MSANIRYILSLSIALLVTLGVYGQEEEEEYIPFPKECKDSAVHLYAEDFESSIVTFTSSTGEASEGTTSIMYLDGLGRPKEEVNVGATPSHNDLVTFHEYDGMGRKTREWQPSTVAPSRSCGYIPYSQYTSAASSAWQDANPYTSYEYEQMPGGRVVKTTGPGSMWHNRDKGQRYEYLTNKAGNDTLNCLKFLSGIATGGTPLLTSSGSYPTGTLLVTRMSDEDGVTTLEFTDRQGRTILSRRIEHNGGSRILYDTYYKYDDYGNLVMIVPPLLSDECRSGAVPKERILEYAYIFGYDKRSRRCSTKMPGAGIIYTEYDGADRPLFVQTAVQRSRNESTFHIYDGLGRECLTGTCQYNIPTSSTDIRTSVPRCTYTGNDNGLMGYTIEGLTLTDAHVLSATYYDDYKFAQGHDELSYTPAEGYGVRFNKAKGLVTGRATAVLSKDKADVPYLYEAMYYDGRQRMIQKKSTNYIGGTESHFYAYDFLGHETAHRHVHTSKIQSHPSTTTIETASTYDHAGRLLTVTHSVNGSTPTTIRNIAYDELGRVKSDRRNGNYGLAQTYDYNARSWMTGITGSLLNMSMCYGLNHDGQVSAFNGNMASVEWNTGNGNRRYSFRYDGLSRLTEARYTEADNGHAGRYNTSYSYDKQGNIESLSRNGLQDGGAFGKVDELYYQYDGNRLCKVSNAVEAPLYKGAMHFADGADEDVEYSYDADGNMTADKNKGITQISYNILNLPEHILFDSGKYTNLTYSATGEKIRADYQVKLPVIHYPKLAQMAAVSGGITIPPINDSLIYKGDMDTTAYRDFIYNYGMHRMDYCDNIIYYDFLPERILFDGGYVTFAKSQPTYHFYLTDHQGNVRMVASAGGAVEETNHYYPFGALFGESAGGGRQHYKYNGKELDRLLALDWYDYGARWYDPVLARWHTIDPLANEAPGISPYVYCDNNAVNRVDPDGKDYWYTNDINQITAFLNAIGKGQNQFDFFGWHHAVDAEFAGNLTYNDKTEKFYTSYSETVNGEVVVIGKSFKANLKPVSLTGYGYPGAFVYEPLENFWQKTIHVLRGTYYNDGLTNWNVDEAGRIVNIAPITGIAPTFGKGKGFFGGKQKMGRPKGNMPGDHKRQNRQIESLAKKHNLDKNEIRKLHDEIHGQGFGYHEIEEFIQDYFGK